MVICLERGVDLHMAQRMQLPLTDSCLSKIQIRFYLSGTFWYRLTWVVPDKGPLSVCVCVCACACVCARARVRACACTFVSISLFNYDMWLMLLLVLYFQTEIVISNKLAQFHLNIKSGPLFIAIYFSS